MALSPGIGGKFTLDREVLQKLILELTGSGYQVMGPTVRDEAIVYDEVNAISDLPEGWTDEQEGGTYRLKKRQDQALFGYNVGPHSWKQFLFPPQQKLWTAKRNGQGFEIHPEDEKPPRYAFLGVRSCELHAIAIQDKVFLGGEYVDPIYKARRENVLIIAVNCGQAGNTCFCVSMNTGPEVEAGFDLVLTEVINNDQHYFVIEAGSDKGVNLLKKLPLKSATPQEKTDVKETVNRAVEQMGRTLNTEGIRSLLQDNADHPRWDDVAKRCLSCANCTMACPTCFCSTVEDVTDLSGDHAERWRSWDSCFTLDFTYMGGGHARHSFKSRYRQWMTHKLSTWHDQFDTSGCVGCGRCITWCPEGIDITEEVAAIQKNPKPPEKTE
jgi:ferredoxin